jgi:hypothetical protein
MNFFEFLKISEFNFWSFYPSQKSHENQNFT